MLIDDAFITAYVMGSASGTQIGDFDTLVAVWLVTSCEYHRTIVRINVDKKRELEARRGKSLA
jgi:hypothetical protein